jgi:transcriptional regulator with XRE-family HTH domain
MRMMQKMDIHDCLIYLEKRGVTTEEIMEKIGCNKTTIQRWWISNKPTPKYLAYMQKWCQESMPIEDLFVGRRPPENMFIEALENAIALVGHEDRKYGMLLVNLTCKGHYDKGTQAGRSRRQMMSGHCYPSFFRKRPETDLVRQIIADFHPDERVRLSFTSEFLKSLGTVDLNDDSASS